MWVDPPDSFPLLHPDGALGVAEVTKGRFRRPTRLPNPSPRATTRVRRNSESKQRRTSHGGRHRRREVAVTALDSSSGAP